MQAIETDNLEVEKIVHTFADELLKRASDEMEAIIWYGSTARGEGTPDSDIDVAIVCHDEHRELRRIALDISAALSLQHDCLLMPFLVSTAGYQEMKQIGRLLVKNLENDGVWIWQRPGSTRKKIVYSWAPLPLKPLG